MLTLADPSDTVAGIGEPTVVSALRILVIVANRLPGIFAPGNEAGDWRSSPGGPLSALEPAVRSSRARWVGWTGVANETMQPFVHDDIELFPVRLNDVEVEEFYNGFSNSTLWPLYHDRDLHPQFHRSWWASYVAINQRFAGGRGPRRADGCDHLDSRLPPRARPHDDPTAARRCADRVLPPCPVPVRGSRSSDSVAQPAHFGDARRGRGRLSDHRRSRQLSQGRGPSARPRRRRQDR